LLLILAAAVLSTPALALAATSSAAIASCPTVSPFGCFTPNPIRVNAGDSVTWTNNTGLTHTATSDSGAWDTGNINAGSTSAAIVFSTPGTFAYHCAIHPSMTGSVIVSAAAATPAPSVPPVKRLASGGAGPIVPGTLLLLVGLGLVTVRGRRRDRSKRA
jgi:plastocyanin